MGACEPRHHCTILLELLQRPEVVVPSNEAHMPGEFCQSRREFAWPSTQGSAMYDLEFTIMHYSCGRA